MKITTQLFLTIITLTFLLLLGFSSCNKDANSEITPTLLLKCWTHSHEENSAQEAVYRPCDYTTFPPSRFRKVYTFKEDNTVDFNKAGVDDIPTSHTGEWTYDGDANTITITENAQILEVLEVIELKDDLLKIAQ